MNPVNIIITIITSFANLFSLLPTIDPNEYMEENCSTKTYARLEEHNRNIIHQRGLPFFRQLKLNPQSCGN